MYFTFERGNSREPRGHAILFFRDARDGNRLAATYLITLPIEMQISKYIPPMFASRMSSSEPKMLPAMPMPPIPEPIGSLEDLERLAAARSDDLISGGTTDLDAPEQLMALTAEAAQRYHQLYVDYIANLPSSAPSEDAPGDLDVQDVLYSLMSEADRVAEVAKLVGKLRYAVEGSDARQVAEAEADLTKVARYLPSSYRLDELIEAARRPDVVGQRLAQLYVERCYRLHEENFEALMALDQQIEELARDPNS